MSENRFRKGDWTNCRYDICEIVTDDDEIICVVALNDADKIIGLLEENEDLREVNKENQRLHEENVKQCERWRKLYEIKDAEVTARVDTLNRVCNYYLTEIGFKSDVDPNKAVKEVINKILNTEVGNDE